MRRIRLAKSGYIFSSAAFCIAGLLLLLHPEISAEVLCKGLGILFLVWGVFKICGYLSGDLYRLAFQFDLACGILAVVLDFQKSVRQNQNADNQIQKAKHSAAAHQHQKPQDNCQNPAG